MLDSSEILEVNRTQPYIFLTFKMIIQHTTVLVYDNIIWVPQGDHESPHQRDKAANSEEILSALSPEGVCTKFD